MGSNRHRAWRMAIATSVVVITAAVLIPVAAIAAPSSKSQDPTVTPGTVYRGTTQTFSIGITNKSTSGNITAMGIRVYVDKAIAYSDIQLPIVAPAPGVLTDPTVTLQAPNPYIEILSANVLRNQTYTFTMTAKIPCAEDASSYTWVTDVRQSNDFSGTGNIIPSSGDPVTQIATGGCHLAFTTQPTNAVPSGTITGTAFDQSALAPRVTVQAQNAANGALAGFSGSITLTSDPASTLSGGGPVSAASATSSASFPNLAIVEDGTYTLTATTDVAGFGPVTSNSFTIVGSSFDCKVEDPPVDCATGTVTGATGSTGNVVVNDQTDQITANIAAAFVPNNIDCAGYVEFGDNLYFNITPAPNTTLPDGLTKTVTMTKLIPVESNTPRPHTAGVDEWRYQVCFQSRTLFQAVPYTTNSQTNYNNLLKAIAGNSFTVDAETVPTADRVLGDKSADEYRGLLPPCGFVGGVAPCVESVTLNPAAAGQPYGTVTFETTVQAVDPQMK